MSKHKPLFCSAGSGYSELVTGFVVVVIAAAVVFICVVVICVVVGIGIVVICVGVGVIWDVVAVVIVCIVVIAADVVICVGVIVISGVVVVCDIVVVGFVDGLLKQSGKPSNTSSYMEKSKCSASLTLPNHYLSMNMHQIHIWKMIAHMSR